MYLLFFLCLSMAGGNIDGVGQATLNDTSRQKRGTKVRDVLITNEYKRFAVIDHNRYRRNANPSAANMRAMLWNDELQESAQRHAENCIYEYSNIRNTRSYSSVSENIFITSATEHGPTFPIFSGAISKWALEFRIYNYRRASCEADCRSYIQLMWDETDKFGCAATVCRNIEVPDTVIYGPIYSRATFIVCQYATGSGAENNANPYARGRSCSQCSSGYVCLRNLCVLPGDSLPSEDIDIDVLYDLNTSVHAVPNLLMLISQVFITIFLVTC